MTRAALDPFWSFSSLSCLLLGSFAHAGCSDAAGTDPDLDDGNGAEGTGGTSIDDGELGNGGENRNSTGGAIGFEPGSGGSNPDVTTTNICASADEDSSATLTCPEGGIITSIVFASFGEPVGECGGFTQTECHASESHAVVESACVGKNSCFVNATNETFGGDPCSFVVKHLRVEAVCTIDGSGSGGGGGANTGGGENSGGTTGAGGSPDGTGGNATLGDLSILDPVPGFASVAGGTTGGGTNLNQAIIVDTWSELDAATKAAGPSIILVEPGNYNGNLAPVSNKTIIGLGPGVMIRGSLRIAGSGVSNVIMRNIAVRGNPCSSYDECRAGADAVYIGNGAHHVWLDHIDISDGQDGNCDVTQGGDYVTISWSRFYYTYNKEHRFSNLIAGSDDEPNSVGKLRITYMNSWWGERVDSRQPRGRFGNVHMLNNYHSTGGGQIHGVGFDMALIAENSVYNENRSIWTDMGSPRGWKGMGNIGTGSNLNDTRGTVFTIPYSYAPMPASEVVSALTSDDCGSGNTCTFAY